MGTRREGRIKVKPDKAKGSGRIKDGSGNRQSPYRKQEGNSQWEEKKEKVAFKGTRRESAIKEKLHPFSS
jgi:hypothetical protein